MKSNPEAHDPRMQQIKLVQTILYVEDQEISTRFYQDLFRREADLNVPGMTEFHLSDQCRIGLMPGKGIAKILAEKTPHPDSGKGIPRCELYLVVDDIQLEYENAIKSGAKLISPIMARNWGDIACYFSDPDGHIIAFAVKTE
jgi:predicted enzyme related to lactoylglutathione lyase